MVHTPIIPKKINRTELQQLRLSFDYKKFSESWPYERIFLQPIIHGDISEDVAKILVHSDFCSRFFSSYIYKPLFFTPFYEDTSHNWGEIQFRSYLHQEYESQYNHIKYSIEKLGIDSRLYSLYQEETIKSLYNCDRDLAHDHRIGVRSDVVYYDISSAKVVPDHRIVTQKRSWDIYTIRFFLNSNKDTLLWDIEYPFYLFGCVAILVNPHDKRYKKIRDKEIILPITNKQVPIISYEGVSVEWHGTHILIPAHNREDFKLALQLWLPTDVYAFDKNGYFTNEAKDFAHKPLQEFSDNIIKYIDDISNLENKKTISIEYKVDSATGNALFPILEKNIYIWLGWYSVEDTTFCDSFQIYGDTQFFEQDIEQDEYFCISNQDDAQPLITNLWGYFSQEESISSPNLLQDIIIDLVNFRFIQFPAKADDIIEILLNTINEQPLRKIFYRYRVEYCDHSYPYKEEVYTLFDNLSQNTTYGQIALDIIDKILLLIDENGIFLYTRHGYILPKQWPQYHYDADYIGLSLLLDQTQSCEILRVFITPYQYKYAKYFMYLYSYLYKKPLHIEIYAVNTSKSQDIQDWKNLYKYNSPDSTRLLLLQSCIIESSDEQGAQFTGEEYERFIMKRRNLSRIIPTSTLTLSWLENYLIEQKLDLTHHDIYLLTKIYELYDEVLFLQKKNHVAQLIYIVISTLWYDIADLLLYIIKKQPGTMTEMVASYVILFSYHILYPLLPTTVIGFLHLSWYQLESDFFEREKQCFVEKNYKNNLMLHIISQWYRSLSQEDMVQWFILQSNRDFLEYCREHIPTFSDFVGNDYIITYIDESETWPDHIVAHKIFTTQWGVEKQNTTIQIETLPSLSLLQGQLQYKQQLLQTMKNTIVRLRTTGQQEKINEFQETINTLQKEITHLEYEISKIKYF